MRKVAVHIKDRLAVSDEEEMALTLNGRKKKLKKDDFVAAMDALMVDRKQQEHIFHKMAKAMPGWMALIDRSFMSADCKAQYKTMLVDRINRIQ
jgi:serine/threonine-protein kinase HipA